MTLETGEHTLEIKISTMEDKPEILSYTEGEKIQESRF